QRVRTVSDLRVGIEDSERRVSHGRPAAARSGIGEQELAILVVRASRACLDVDFVVVVFAGALEQTAELERVISPNPGKAVGNVVNRPGRMRRVWPAA